MAEIVLDGESLTFEQVISVAYDSAGEPGVVLSDAAKMNVNRCAEAVQTLIERKAPGGRKDTEAKDTEVFFGFDLRGFVSPWFRP